MAKQSLNKGLRAGTGGYERSRGMQRGTAEVETTLIVGETSLQPRPVRHKAHQERGNPRDGDNQGAVVEVPGIQSEARNLSPDTLNEGWRDKANPSGPRGSPCCTPQQL